MQYSFHTQYQTMKWGSKLSIPSSIILGSNRENVIKKLEKCTTTIEKNVSTTRKTSFFSQNQVMNPQMGKIVLHSKLCASFCGKQAKLCFFTSRK